MSDTLFSRFGLLENPFQPHSDSRYTFFSSQFQQNWTELTYGIENRKGLIVLTGDADTGKSVLISHLISWLLQRESPYALVTNRNLGVGQLLDSILAGFSIACSPGMNNNKLFCLNQWLLARYRAGKLPVLILEDAHRLPPRVLEQVRMLLNFETPREKLLQIVLVGQPELEDKLKAPALRQFRQRIALRCKTGGFAHAETAAYIEERLRAAGADRPIFTPEALAAIHTHSGGVVPAADALCRQSMAAALDRGSSLILAEHVSEATARSQTEFASAGIPRQSFVTKLDPALLTSLRQALSAHRESPENETRVSKLARPFAPAPVRNIAPRSPAQDVSRYPAVANLDSAPPRPVTTKTAELRPGAALSVDARPTLPANPAAALPAASHHSPSANRPLSRRLYWPATVAAAHCWGRQCLELMRAQVERIQSKGYAVRRELDSLSERLRSQTWPRIRSKFTQAAARAKAQPSVGIALHWMGGAFHEHRSDFHQGEAWRAPRLAQAAQAGPFFADFLVRLYARSRRALSRIAARASAHPKTRALQRWLLEPLDSPRRRSPRPHSYSASSRHSYPRRIKSAQTGSRS